MSATVHVNPATGAATITLTSALSAGQELKLAIFDTRSARYLSEQGWSNSRRTAVRIVPDVDMTEIVLDPALANRLSAGTQYILEDIFINFRESVVWPAPPPPEPPPVVTPSAEPEATVSAAEPSPVTTVKETSGEPILVQTAHAAKAARAPMIALGLVVGAALMFAVLRLWPQDPPPLNNTPSPGLIAREVAAADKKRQLDSYAQRLAHAQAKLDQQQASLKASRTTDDASVAALRADRDSLQAQLAESERKLQSTLGKLDESLKAGTDLFGQVQDLKRAASHATDDAVVIALRADRDQLQVRFDDKERKLQDTIGKLDAALQTNSDLSSQLRDRKNAASETQATDPQIGNITGVGQLTALTAERDRLLAKTSDAEQKYNGLVSRYQDLFHAKGVISEKLGYEQKLSAELTTQLETQTELVRTLQAQKTASFPLEQNLATYKAKVEQQEQRIEYLEKQAQNTSARTRAVWGAIVVDRGGSIYTILNQTSEEAAIKNTKYACKAQSRDGQCEVFRTYSNSCLAWARSGKRVTPDNFAYEIAASKDTAASTALTKCDELGGVKCELKFAGCSPDAMSAEE